MRGENYKIKFIALEDKVIDIVHNKNSRRNKTVWNRNEYENKEIVWSLRRYIGEEVNDGIGWQYQGSEQKINDEVTAEIIVTLLNEENQFDFEYLPKENDFLILKSEYITGEIKNKSRPYIGSYISFLFRQGKWLTNKGYDHISKVYEDFKKGIVI